MRRIFLLSLLALGLIALPSGLAATTEVSITSTGFHPNAITIPAGDALTWSNGDTARHQVVANDGSFSSPVLASKQSYSHTFKAGGSFAYHDGLHPSLRGSVAVIPVRTVWITSNGFVPLTMSIRTGQTVTWVNKTNANKQVTADDASFASPVLAAGARYSHTFSTAGTFGYHDGLQPALKGTVVVTAPPVGESITLESNVDVVTYSGSLLLSGAASNGTAGEKVAITANPASAGMKAAKSVLTTTTAANGSFSATVHPVVHTVYVASTGKSTSDPLSIDVRPRLRLARLGRTHAVATAFAARSFLHHYVLLQRFRSRSGVWATIARVRFTRVTSGASPTVMSGAVFRLHVRHGLRLRVFMPFGQARPGYVSGSSNAIRS
jgi:plastocyanin